MSNITSMLTIGNVDMFSVSKYLPADIRNTLQIKGWAEYQSRIDNRLSMYNDDWADELALYIQQFLSAETIAQFFPSNRQPLWPIPTHINLLKRIVDEISLIYKNKPVRVFQKEEGDEEGPKQGAQLDTIIEPAKQEKSEEKSFVESDRYKEIVDDQYDMMMHSVNQLTNVCNMCIVIPWIDPTSETGFRFDVLTPDMFIPIQHPDDSSRLIGIMFRVSNVDTGNTVTSFLTELREVLIYMGKEDEEPFIATMDRRESGNVEKQSYPYYYQGEKYLPCAVFRNGYPSAGEFVNRTKGDDLYQANLITGWLISQWLRNYQDSTGKQLFLMGSGSEKIPRQIIRDSMSITHFPINKDAATMEQIEFDIDLKSRWEAILQSIEPVLSNYGMSIDRFKSVPASGVSLRVQNEGIINIIESHWSYYKVGEEALANIIRKMNNTMIAGVEGIPDDYEFYLDFGALPFEEDISDKWDFYTSLAEKGLMSYAELLTKVNPDVGTADDAQDVILKNLQMNRELKKVGFQSMMPTGNITPIKAAPAKVPMEPNPLLQTKKEEEII